MAVGKETDGLVIEVIEGETTAVFVAVTAIDDEPTKPMALPVLPRTRTETWSRKVRRRR